MPVTPSGTTTAPRLAYHDVLSDDGTRLRAWTNDADGVLDGPTVLLCNGLGTSPYAWPAFLDPACDVRVVSWNHRGTGGSARPADLDHVGIEAFAEDGLSVMDHFGLERAVLVGWSMGVNTAFEIAVEHPERVAGIFAVAGVPGDTFATMLGPLRVPPLAARTMTVGAAKALNAAGHLISPVTTRLPVGRRAIDVVSHSGFMLPVADPELARRAVSAFLQTPVEWYFHVALHTSRHPRIRLSRVRVPAAFVAGRWDLLAGHRAMRSAAARMADATYTELRGSHFLQMEHPDEVHRQLLEFLHRVG
ncbi:alpha/beta fold hydrolase [Nocardioides sp.]|uniref:alpha/beta fold hydrolase n=1 Tax=Nocardioides sp. TaxID=35761 RepID=UPI003783311B